MKHLVTPSSIFIFYFFLIHRRALLSANQRQCLLNRVNVPRICWAKLIGPWKQLCRSWTKTPNYIRKAKVRPIKNQLYSPNTPKYVREQTFVQLRTGLRDSRLLHVLSSQHDVVVSVVPLVVVWVGGDLSVDSQPVEVRVVRAPCTRSPRAVQNQLRSRVG